MLVASYQLKLFLRTYYLQTSTPHPVCSIELWMGPRVSMGRKDFNITEEDESYLSNCFLPIQHIEREIRGNATGKVSKEF